VNTVRDLRNNNVDVDLVNSEKLVVALLIAIAVGAGVYGFHVATWKLPPPNLARLDKDHPPALSLNLKMRMKAWHTRIQSCARRSQSECREGITDQPGRLDCAPADRLLRQGTAKLHSIKRGLLDAESPWRAYDYRWCSLILNRRTIS
jgi:hypothetical protein